MMITIADIRQLYPSQQSVWQTSDGLLHLSEQDARAQAIHLSNQKIKTIVLKK